MTTIAWDGKILAADGQITRDHSIVMATTQQKIFKNVGVFDVLAFCGDWMPVDDFLGWAENPEETQPPIGAYTVIFVINGVLHFSNMETPISECMTLPSGAVDAWGSGAHLALGALHSGKTARQAVNLACKLDVFTGGKVRSVRVVK